MGKETPTFGEGSTPWTAGIYIEGETLYTQLFFLGICKMLFNHLLIELSQTSSFLVQTEQF